MTMSLLIPLGARTLPKAVAAYGVHPAAVALFDRFGSRLLTTGVRSKNLHHDDDLLNKTYSDAFDESDSLEAGKRKDIAAAKKPLTFTSSSYPNSLWAHHFRDIDNFFFSPRDTPFRNMFTRDPFVAPFFRQQRSDPFIDIMPDVLRGFPCTPGQMLSRSSLPGCKINETDDGCIKISVDVPDGIKASDMKVEVDNKDGTLLHISGKRESVELEYGTKSMHRFEKSFSLGHHLDVDKLTGNLSDGVLVFLAPKVEPHLEQDEPQKKTIAISEEPCMPSDEEIIQNIYSSAFDESDWAEMGKLA